MIEAGVMPDRDLGNRRSGRSPVSSSCATWDRSIAKAASVVPSGNCSPSSTDPSSECARTINWPSRRSRTATAATSSPSSFGPVAASWSSNCGSSVAGPESSNSICRVLSRPARSSLSVWSSSAWVRSSSVCCSNSSVWVCNSSFCREISSSRAANSSLLAVSSSLLVSNAVLAVARASLVAPAGR